jgi:hypothetical protein
VTAYPIGVEVSCDGPDEDTDCPHSAAVSASYASRTAPQVRADGRAQGWIVRRRDGRLRDLCGACASIRASIRDRDAEAPTTCRCEHPVEEHSVYGCVDGCGCEWMPKRRGIEEPGR